MLEHIAIWTSALEEMKTFYCSYFNGQAGGKFCNDTEFNAHFESYFLSFGEGSRLELMRMPTIPEGERTPGYEAAGLTHIAFSVADRACVDELVRRAHSEGRTVVLEPHRTADGYYEACILDPDGNRVEITVLPE